MSLTFVGAVPIVPPQTTALTVVVTGASRGLGFELVRQYATAHADNVVFAGVRHPETATELQSLAKQHSNIHVIEMDVDSEASIKASVPLVERHTSYVDVLINNAAISPPEALAPLKTTSSDFDRVMHTNVTGTMATTLAYVPLLQRSKVGAKVANISSLLGSNLQAAEFGQPLIAYGVSKAAVTYLTTCFRYAVPDVTFLALHPGWVATEMGSVVGAPPTQIKDSVSALRYYIATRDIKNTGDFIDCMSGNAIPF